MSQLCGFSVVLGAMVVSHEPLSVLSVFCSALHARLLTRLFHWVSALMPGLYQSLYAALYLRRWFMLGCPWVLSRACVISLFSGLRLLQRGSFIGCCWVSLSCSFLSVLSSALPTALVLSHQVVTSFM
jgi:hypothetical protein